MRWTPEQFMHHLESGAKKPAKFRNAITVVDGIRFDSKKEAQRYFQLQAMQRSGLITELQRQVSYELAPKVKFNDASRSQPALRIIVDFTYVENGELVLEDVKSKATITSTFTAKRHMLLAKYGLQIRIYT